MVHSDGASRGNPGPAASAAIVSAWDGNRWIRVVHGRRLLGHATSVAAELNGASFGLELVEAFLSQILLVA